MHQLAEQLVGRTAELAALDEALAQLQRGRSAALELVGEPGIGKTRLLAELGARAEGQGRLVLSGSASEIEGELPFWVFVDALDEYLQGLEPRRLDALGDDVRAELGGVFPSLRDGAATGGGERYRTYRAARRLLEALASLKPLVLLLDDLHWADAGSIDLLGALLRRPPAGGVLIALAVRPRQIPERLSGSLERAERAGTLTRLDLVPLTAAEAGELLGVDDAAVLYGESGGNPFYLQQLARAPRRPADGNGAGGVSLAGVEVPRAVAAALTDELALLPDDARRALDGAAVAGDPFEPELAAAAAGLDAALVIDALDELLRRDLVRATDVPRRFRFRHPLVRGAVYEAAPGGWRLLAHERSAALLAERGVAAAERAHHVERSARHGDLAAVAVLKEAGESAARHAPATAAQRFGAALRLLAPEAPERIPLLMARAQAALAAGQLADGYEATNECLQLLPDDDVAAYVRVTAASAALAHLLGMHDEAHARLLAGLGRLEEGSPEAVALMIMLGIDGLFRRDYAAMRSWSQRALDAARDVDDPTLHACAAALVAWGCVCDGDAETAGRACDESAALVDGLSDDELARSLEHGGAALAAAELYLGRCDDAARHAERALAVARAAGRGELSPVLFWAGTVRAGRGRLPEAAEIFETAIESCRVSGHVSALAWNLQGRAFTAIAAGEAAAARAAAEEAVATLAERDEGLPATWAGFALAAVLELDGEPARAADLLLESGGGAELPQFPASWRAAAFEVLTRCRLACGQPEAAASAAASAAAAAVGFPLARVQADRAAALVALDRGDASEAASRALAAAAAADEVDAVIEAAHARLLAGRALAHAGNAEAAADELQRAAAEFDKRGALPRRDAAERELRRLGHRRLHRRTRPGTADSGVESLTERELQVARLVVDRKTNPQIAAELFLSQKTVETHLRNLFHKLGVSSRVDVARVVERADRDAAGSPG